MMQIDNRAQALALLVALGIGLASGLLYDLLRPARWQGGRLLSLLLDTLFCLLLGAGFFVYAMSCGDGRLGLGALALAWIGFLFYQKRVSPALLPIFVNIFSISSLKMEKAKKILKKSGVFAKKIFQKLKK